jgi:hypothetical protein
MHRAVGVKHEATVETVPAPTFVDDLRTMMDAWSKIETAVKAAHPKASPDAVYRMTAAAMNRALKVTSESC